MLVRVRKWFDGASLFVGGAVVLLAFALLAVLLGLQSPDRVLWTGQQVTGTEHGGIVTYGWHGQSYSLDMPGYGSAQAVSVYLDPADPSQAMVDNVFDRTVAAVLTLGPAAGALVLLVVGGTQLPVATPEIQTGPRVQALSFGRGGMLRVADGG